MHLVHLVHLPAPCTSFTVCGVDGMLPASFRNMGARDPEELVAWRLAHALKLVVYAITARPDVRRDFGFCNQIREAASSGEDNIAEGFWRYGHGDFARFLMIARSSIGEVHNKLGDGFDRGHLNRDECDQHRRLATRALKATSRLHAYLKSSDTPHFPRKTEDDTD